MKKANRFVGDWLIKQQLAARFLRTRGKPSEKDSLMVSDASQAPLSQIVDFSVLSSGERLHNLQPGTVVPIQEWHSLSKGQRDQIRTDLLARGLTLLPAGQDRLSVGAIDASPATELVPVNLADPDLSTQPDATPPDSQLLTVRVQSGGVQPASPYSIPGAFISGISRELATHVAVTLNRETLQRDDSTVWHVVAYTVSGGFAVVRLFFPKGWKPRTEYDTPPSAECGLMNAEARMTAVRFNRMQMESGTPVKFWQLHIKPLEYPRFVPRVELTEFEAASIRKMSEGLGFHVNVNRCRNGELNLKFGEPLNSLQWRSDDGHVSGLARSLRQIGQRFLDAAHRLDGTKPKEDPLSLYAVHHNERMIRIGGYDDIMLMVANASSDEAAFDRVRELLFHGS